MKEFHKPFFEKYEFLIPLILFSLFLVFTLLGISWGAPDLWHPDEIVVRSIKAISGEWQFSQTNFDYPDLPQYVMFGLGKILTALGQTKKGIIIGSRVLSAVLAGLSVVLTYIITRRIGGSVYVAGLSGFLLICVNTQVECDFFKQLDTGQSNHYKLIAEFSYHLPAYLPQIEVAFVNPSIRIYERIK